MPPAPQPERAPQYSDYGHLARVKEWSSGEDGDELTTPIPAFPSAAPPIPRTSVWVAASAGTGKTKVLTDRVLALLLAGTPPERCSA